MSRFIILAVAWIALAGVAIADDVKSGLAPGKSATSFIVRDITGPNRGKSLCYRCAYEDRPVACIFIRETGEGVPALIQRIDAAVIANQSKDMRAFVVLLTDDIDAGAKQLTKLSETRGIRNVPLTIFEDPAGPLRYRISKDAAVTVLMWKKARVAADRAFGSAKLTEAQIQAVLADTSKILN